MAAPLHTSLFKLPKKLSLSPSTRKSWRQIVVTLVITFFILGGIAWLENEQRDEQRTEPKCSYELNIKTLRCLISNSLLLGQVQNLGVLSAAILFFWDTFDRKKQLERQAWQLIDGALGSETSGARRQAIEELHKEHADITGLDADSADLREINLSYAKLSGASFKNAILERANFEGADLTQANFEGANLRGVNFKKAELLGAIFTKSDLRISKKIGDIGKKPSEDEDVKKTDFRDADLRYAVFNEARLEGAIFGIVQSETSEYSLREILILRLYNLLKLGSNSCIPPLGSGTKLMNAKFWDADLSSVNLTGVNISNAQFGGAKVEQDVISKAQTYKDNEKNFFQEDEGYDEYKKVQ